MDVNGSTVASSNDNDEMGSKTIEVLRSSVTWPGMKSTDNSSLYQGFPIFNWHDN